MANILDDPWIAEAVRRFQDEYASVIANRRVKLVEKKKALLKFGRNVNMTSGAVETIWDTGIANETYVETNVIDRIVSSSNSDTGTVIVEGHYTTGGNEYHFFIIQVQLNGQTPVGPEGITVISDVFGAFASGACRITRFYNNTGTALVGDVYIYQDGVTVTAGVPQDLTKVHAKIRGSAGLQQTNKCATTISNEDFYILTTARAGVARQTAAFVDFSLEVRLPGKVFREKTLGVTSRDSGFSPIFQTPPFIIVPPNSDIRMRGTASASSTTGIAEFNGILGKLE